jgi:hypothetical protein
VLLLTLQESAQRWQPFANSCPDNVDRRPRLCFEKSGATALRLRSAHILQEVTYLKIYYYPLFWVTIIMSNSTEDDRIKAFVAALTLALQHIVSKPPDTAGTKRKPRKHKKADQGKTKRVDQKS